MLDPSLLNLSNAEVEDGLEELQAEMEVVEPVLTQPLLQHPGAETKGRERPGLCDLHQTKSSFSLITSQQLLEDTAGG